MEAVDQLAYEDLGAGLQLYHGDSLQLLPFLEDLRPQVVLTDPPYGIAFETDLRRFGRSTNRTWEAIAGDAQPFDPQPWLELAPTACMFGANYYSDRLPAGKWIVWNKRDAQETNMLLADAELAWHNGPGRPVQVFNWYWNGCYRKGEMGTALHPMQKPLALMRHLVEHLSEPGDLVVDPFMGSGPIAQACRDLGRGYVGVELQGEYVQAAINRLAQEVLPI